MGVNVVNLECQNFLADMLIDYFKSIEYDEFNEKMFDFLEHDFECPTKKLLSAFKISHEVVYYHNTGEDDVMRFKVVKFCRGELEFHIKFKMYEGSYTYIWKYDNEVERCEPKVKSVTYYD